MAAYQNGYDAEKSGLQHIADPASGVSGLQTVSQYPNANHYYSPTHEENSYHGTNYSGSSPQTAYSSTPSEPKGGPPPPVNEKKRICGLGPRLFWIVVALVGIIIVAAAVGGGVGGAMAAKHKKEKAVAAATTGLQAASVTSSSSSSQPTSTSSVSNANRTSTTTSAAPIPTQAATDYGFKLTVWSGENFTGQSATYKDVGIVSLPFQSICYFWDPASNGALSGCCVRFCDHGNTTGYRCMTKTTQPKAVGKGFNKVTLSCPSLKSGEEPEDLCAEN